jgi:hypothetical protein
MMLRPFDFKHLENRGDYRSTFAEKFLDLNTHNQLRVKSFFSLSTTFSGLGRTKSVEERS